MIRKGAPKVLNVGVRLNIKIEASMLSELRKHSRKRDKTLSKLCRQIFREWLDIQKGDSK